MLLTSLTIARKPARLTASRLRRSERTNRSEATRKGRSTFRLKHPERSELMFSLILAFSTIILIAHVLYEYIICVDIKITHIRSCLSACTFCFVPNIHKHFHPNHLFA